MQTVRLEKPSNITRKLIVTVPVAALQSQFNQALVEQQKKSKLKGFRPGNAPLGIVQKYYGEDIKQKLFSKVIDDSYQRALIDEKLTPVSRPKIEPVVKQKDEDWLTLEKDFQYEATFEIMPEIKLKEYKGLSVKKPKIKVTQKDIDALVENLRNAHADMSPIAEDQAAKYKVKKGDFVDTTFKGKLETENGFEEKDGMSGTQVIEIGSNQMIPGFEDELVGLKKGDSKTFKITFPKDYGAADFQNKTAEFEVSVNEIKQKKLPEVNEEFAKEAGYESLEDLKAKAKEAVQKSQEDQAKSETQNSLIEQLVKKNKFDVPQSLIQAQMQGLMNEFAQNLKRQGLPEDRIQSALQDSQKEFLERAEQQVRAGLLLDRIANAEKIEVTDADIKSEYERVAQATQMKINEVEDYYAKNQKAKENIEFRLKEVKTIDFLIENSK